MLYISMQKILLWFYRWCDVRMVVYLDKKPYDEAASRDKNNWIKTRFMKLTVYYLSLSLSVDFIFKKWEGGGWNGRKHDDTKIQRKEQSSTTTTIGRFLYNHPQRDRWPQSQSRKGIVVLLYHALSFSSTNTPLCFESFDRHRLPWSLFEATNAHHILWQDLSLNKDSSMIKIKIGVTTSCYFGLHVSRCHLQISSAWESYTNK